MKAINAKQRAWSDRKVAQALGRARTRFVLILALLFALPAISFAVSDPTRDNIKIAAEIGGSGTALAGMSLIGNISEGNPRESAGNFINIRIQLIAREQVDPDSPFPTPNANRELGTIPLLTGEYMHYFEGINNSPEDNATGEMGELTVDRTNTFSISMTGQPAKLLDFIEQYAGKGFIIIYRENESTDHYVRGSYDKPMMLKSYDAKKGKEAKVVTLTFEGKGYHLPLKYVGSIVTAAPDTISAGATDLAITDNPQYRMSAHSSSVAIATVSGIAAADYGRTIDILGIASGVNPPTIADNTVFVLIDGATFTGNIGSRISFRILDDETLVEIEGSRYQT